VTSCSVTTNGELIVAVAHAPRGSAQFWVYSGKLPSLKVGRRRLIAEDALRRFLGLDTDDGKHAQRCRIMTDEGPRSGVSAAMARHPREAYTNPMAGPSSRPVQGGSKEGAFAPHPDDEADVRAGLEEAERGELLSEEESAAYVRSLIGDAPSGR
jgi:hypothetical protein